MKLGKKAYAIIAAVVVSGGLAVGISGSALASSHTPIYPVGGGAGSNCANGIYAGYCGTQQSGTGLYIAVGWRGQIIGTYNEQPWNAEFFWFADASSTAANNDKYAVFAPNGVVSNKVMADVNHHIVLATASGAWDQRWVYDGTGWVNVGTGDVLRSTYNGGPILAVTGPSSGPSETWTFVVP
jgi:hypothetical protein